MIKSLAIDNIALIEHVELAFDEGLTVLSGETGSGKSIIIDSLAFVLGDRADKSLIKYGKDYAEVTALFEVSGDSEVLSKLNEYGYGSSEEILLSRKMSVTGKNEVRIQGKTATLSILKDICGDLVDIFGQGQHLALLNEKNQLSTLDAFCDFRGCDAELKNELPRLSSINRELKSLGGSDAERERLLDILQYQISEITDADLDADEENELLERRKMIVNAEKISSALGQAVECLNSDNGAVSQASRASAFLSSVSQYVSGADDMSDRLNSASLEMADVCSNLENVLSFMEFSPAEADRVEERLEKIKQIKRKYGGTVDEALRFLSEAKTKYDDLTNATEKIEKLNSEKESVLAKMYALSKSKSEIRKQTARSLSDLIMKELCGLGMKGTNFVVDFSDEPTFEQFCLSPSGDGFDKVEFLMSANVGEPLKPLSKVISGGEMSRFMLAVKNITALAEKIPTMVFDEIDTGISGSMAQKVAEKLANVSHSKSAGYQCIVITHLSQIAAMADNNLYIEKFEENGKTRTTVQNLKTADEKAKEVARLMGGVGEHSLVSANELVAWANEYKRSIDKK